MATRPFDQEWLNARGFRRSERTCSFPNCNNKAIESHLVAVRHLSSIAESGHVVSPTKREHQLPSNMSPKIDKVGIRSAPIMTLYCNIHDDLLFSDLEKHGLVTDNIARALLHRTRHFELHKKLSFKEIGTIASVRGQLSGYLTAE